MRDNILTSSWHYPTEVCFEIGGFQHLLAHLSALGATRPLWVVDEFLLSLPVVRQVLDEAMDQGIHCSVFSDFKSNPTSEHVELGCDQFCLHQCDAVVAMGGGSALDVAKTIALVAEQEHGVWDFVDGGDRYLQADANKIPPIIAVPTTAGTGSEVGRAALITHPDTHEKKIIFHPNMLPSLVLCDAELTRSLSPALTAATGMDALTHNVEALCASGFHPMADGIALEGARLVKENLLNAYHDGDDLQARGAMLAASLMGAAAFQKGLGAVHALSHPVGGLYDAHHGLLNAIFLPYVLEINRPAIESRMQRLARYLDLPEASFDAVLSWVCELNAQLQLPSNLADIGIDLSQADLIAERALLDPSADSNPLPLSFDDYRCLFASAVRGELTQRLSV